MRPGIPERDAFPMCLSAPRSFCRTVARYIPMLTAQIPSYDGKSAPSAPMLFQEIQEIPAAARCGKLESAKGAPTGGWTAFSLAKACG